MVVAVQSQEPITAIVPARPSSSRNGSHPSDEPVLEIKQKTSSRHEKRTKRDYYRHSGDDKQPPIEYVYTYSEETPKPDPDAQKTSTDLVPVNGNAGPGKIECTVGEDGNLVVRIRGKPDSVPLDPDNLPIKLPDGWQLKEIQTNQRSRKTERSRKTRIKDEVLLDGDENEKAVVVYNEHTVAVNGDIVYEPEQPQHGIADEQEYIHGERDGVTFVQKKSRKYEEGPAGLISKIEESRSEEGIDFDHPNNKQRSSRNLHSLMERTESAKRKFSKQSVTDEKVTEKHTSNVMYFDGNSSSGGAAENLRDDRTQSETTTRSQYDRSDVQQRGRRDHRQDHDIIVESPEDTPYNSLDRRDHRHHREHEEVINIEDRYRNYSPANGRDRVGDANYDSSNYSTLNRTDKDITQTERDLYREDIYGPDGSRRHHPGRQATEKDVTETERELFREDIYGPDGTRQTPSGRHGTDKTVSETERELYREDIYGPDGSRRSHPGRPGSEKEVTQTDRELYREDIYGPDGSRRPHPDRSGSDKEVTQTDRELYREDIYEPNGNQRRPANSSQIDERTERTSISERYSQSGGQQPTGSNFRPSSQVQNVNRDESLYERSDTRNTNLTEGAGDWPIHNSRLENNTHLTETNERTDVTESYRNNGLPLPNGHRDENSSRNVDRNSLSESHRSPYRGPQETFVENTERTDINERYVTQPGGQPVARRPDSRQSETVETRSEFRSTREERGGRPPSGGGPDQVHIEFRNDRGSRDQLIDHKERSDTKEQYRPGQTTSSYSELRRTDRTEDLRESLDRPTSRTDRFEKVEDFERRQDSTILRPSDRDQTSQPTGGSRLNVNTDKTTRTDITSMVGTEITVNGAKSPSPLPTQERKGNKERVTIDDRYRVIGRSDDRPLTHAGGMQPSQQQTNFYSTDQQTEQTKSGQNHVKPDDTHQRTTDSLRDSNFSQHVTEKEKHRSHSRLTEASSTGERIVPVGISTVPEGAGSRRSSRVSSVDLSEIKPGEHLDNRALKDRGNLAQNGSLGQRRPPSRNPAKYHFGDENGPDDVLSTSDTTMPTHFGGTPFRTTSVPRGAPSVASSDLTGLYIERNGLGKTQTSTVQQQQRTMRDERVLVNYTDTSTKPDWVQNIDQHFAGRRQLSTISPLSTTSGIHHHNIHYARENVTSPTPRIEEIVTIPGSTVITVNGETEPVHGIVTEPGDRPLLPVAHPIERDVVHQSEKGSKYGFTRVTESKGFKQSAKEKVQYQERQENTRQISVSYSVPGKGKETREYTWDGVHEQPEEKITFQEDREHRKDVSLTLGLESQPQLPQRTTTDRTETTDLKEKFVFEETRVPPKREVSVNLSLETHRQKEEVVPRHPIETNTFHFEEEVKRERAVNLVLGLDQDKQRLQNIHEKQETHRSAHHERKELYDIRTQEVQDIDYYEPVPKVTFHEDREVKKDVSFTLGLENYEAAPSFEPLPVEKITFEETREIISDHDVAVVFGLDTPAPPVRSPRPVSVQSNSTVRTPEIVPQITKVREDIKTVETFEKIIEEAVLDTRVVVTPPPPPSPPSARVIAATEIIPPLPRKVSLTAAIDSLSVHHNEVDLEKPSDSTRIFETSVELEARKRRERAEQKLQMEPPPPHPLPPTSGRIEKHIHLEKIVPEPTGEPLPESLGTYGFVYKATLEPKRPELEQTIDFHVVEQPPVEVEERVETLQWYVKEGKPPSEIPDDRSETTIGELRAATPPYHGELTATAEITPPTRVTAVAEITPPTEKPKVKEPPRVTAEAKIEPPKLVHEPFIPPPVPAKQFYFGEDEEDRLSVYSGHSWEEQPQVAKVVPPPVEPKPVKPSRPAKVQEPTPPETRVTELSRKPGAQAVPTHHTELTFATPEEEELWKTSLERHALPSRKRAEQSLQLERAEERPRTVPKPSGRIPKKVWSEKIDMEATGQHDAKALGTYGFLYTATLNPQAVVHGRPLEVEEWQITQASSSIDLDVQQVLLAAFTDIEPPLTPKQQHQLLIASCEIFPPLTEQQQEQLLNALSMINPALTIDQQRQLLTGSEIVPPLTHRQQQQLMRASAEIIPGLTPKQEKQLFYASLQVDPPLTPDQQQQLLFAVSEIFPPASGPRPARRTVKEIEEMTRSVEEEEDEMEAVYRYGRKKVPETMGRINRRGEWEKTTVETEREESVSTDILNRRKQYESKTEHWTEGTTDTSRIGERHRSERHIGHGSHLHEKEVPLPHERRWLAEQSTYLEDEDQDLEVTAINLNIKPRIKSELLMAPSPPARSMSPARSGAGFGYRASPQMGTPPMTEYSGFMYEAPVDGHASPMSAELGRYGFTYQATLDGSESYRKLAAEHMGELELYTRESHNRHDTPKTMSNTPPRRSPWSTPPVTPTPVMAAGMTPPPPTSRDVTPLPPVKELPEPSKDSLWKRQGKSVYETDITGGKEYPPVEMTFPVDEQHRQELRGQLDSPEEEVYEKVTEKVIRRRQEQELTYEERELQRIAAEATTWLKGTETRPTTTADPSRRGRGQADPSSDHREEYSASSYSRQERVERESRQGLGDRGPPPTDVVEPRLDQPFKCNYPLAPPPPTSSTGTRPTTADPNQQDPSSSRREEYSSTSYSRQERLERESRQGLGDRGPPTEVVPTPRSRSREELERKKAEVVRQAEELETLYDSSQESNWSYKERTERELRRSQGPSADSQRTRDPSRDRSREDIERKTTSVVNRVQEMAVLYDNNQPDSSTPPQSHRWRDPNSNPRGTQDTVTETKTESVIKRTLEMESEQKTAAAAKRKKDLEAEEQARREREEVERTTAAVVRRVKEMEDEQKRIRRESEQSDTTRQVPTNQPDTDRPLGLGPDRVLETTMRRTQHREVHFEDETTLHRDPPGGGTTADGEKQPAWVRLVEERKRRQEPLQQYFRPDKFTKKDAPTRQLEVFPEEDPLDASLERIADRKRQTVKSSPEASPSSLRKWGNTGALSSSTTTLHTTKGDDSFNKGFRRHTTETKEVIEESRFHSEEAMLEALESGDSNLISTMSQSLPSLALMKLMENASFGSLDRELQDAVSMEELRKTSTKLKRADGAEEEVRDVSFARRGDTVSPETKRTKRTVVRKLVNGEWKEIAVREEDIPLDSDVLAAIDQPAERILAQMKSPEDDEWSLSDAVIEETTTTRTIRRVEEEEEDIISLAGTEC